MSMTDERRPGWVPQEGQGAESAAGPVGRDGRGQAGALAAGEAVTFADSGVCQSGSPEETLAHARALAPRFARALVLLEGPLGAGKTLWVKGFAAGLGLQRPVYSPTFTLLNHYAEGDRSLFHLDLYRIGSLEELHDIGLFDILDAGLPCLIEWPERVPSLAALPHLHVSLAYAGDGEGRVITWAWRPKGV
ncbi:MAG: TsaE protein, required for threonylcarbamoyladenosine t(6)A37 formation in tRNA [Candidatus Ozemobacter sibiricus]|uniref:tRNA threonylcarbamoyladenosine biosynthesis protein TsaE n=1 Tax=Candidatus Ozemobacter sibiricus TaxID=2268124 RepID=A0A367ZS58_9BACT|nr:MAG: TsaE protein, required for threonylcarbamoyladenosine t(6)A37 formation in tRNA [Candidatus Ozemobacter sibiricus]